MFNFFGKLTFALICLIGSVAFSRAIVDFVQFCGFDPAHTFWPFLAGASLYFLLWAIFFAHREPFWSVLEHEIIHLIFAVLSFKRVHSIYAGRNGGRVETEGDNFVIALAPYFFPLTTVIVLLFKPAVNYELQFWLNGVLGFSLMFHLIYLLKEFHFNQPDLQRNGLLFSSVVIIFFNILFVGLCISSLQGNWQDMNVFLISGYAECHSYFESARQVFWQTSQARLP